MRIAEILNGAGRSAGKVLALKRGLASPDIGDALALTFAQPVSTSWDLPVQTFYETEYDLYAEIDEEYGYGKDEYDE